VLYADDNVGYGQHVVKRFFILPALAKILMADAPNLAQFVSRRSILPTGNLATLCRSTARSRCRELGTTDAERHQT
jgi:hypothetical protein